MIEPVTIGPCTLYNADCRDVLPALADGSVNCCVTSPPYFGLRDYGVDGQIGLEPTPDEFVGEMVKVFREVRRLLADDGTCWLNLGDSYSNVGKWGGSTSGKHAKDLHGDTQIGRKKRDYRRVPCGGCGNSDAEKRCVGCLHNFGANLKPKDLIGIPWRVAFALQADGWYLRSDIIWHKPNPMPESVTDRPTKAHEYVFLLTKAHEYVFLLTKSARYWYDADAIREKHARLWDSSNGGNLSPTGDHKANGEYRERGGKYPEPNPLGRNARSVWSITPKPFSGAHFATMPPKLAERCILAGCPEGGTVLDPFTGAGTTAVVAVRNGRRFVGSELNETYLRDIITPRIRDAVAAEKSSLFPAGADL